MNKIDDKPIRESDKAYDAKCSLAFSLPLGSQEELYQRILIHVSLMFDKKVWQSGPTQKTWRISQLAYMTLLLQGQFLRWKRLGSRPIKYFPMPNPPQPCIPDLKAQHIEMFRFAHKVSQPINENT